MAFKLAEDESITPIVIFRLLEIAPQTAWHLLTLIDSRSVTDEDVDAIWRLPISVVQYLFLCSPTLRSRFYYSQRATDLSFYGERFPSRARNYHYLEAAAQLIEGKVPLGKRFLLGITQALEAFIEHEQKTKTSKS